MLAHGMCSLSNVMTILSQCSAAPDLWPLCPFLCNVLLCHLLSENWLMEYGSMRSGALGITIVQFPYSCLGEAESKACFFQLK